MQVCDMRYIFKNLLCHYVHAKVGVAKRVRKSFIEIQLWNHNIAKLFPERIKKKRDNKNERDSFLSNFESLSVFSHHFRDDLIALLNTVHTWARVIVFKARVSKKVRSLPISKSRPERIYLCIYKYCQN